jgi:hypothetical protein
MHVASAHIMFLTCLLKKKDPKEKKISLARRIGEEIMKDWHSGEYEVDFCAEPSYAEDQWATRQFSLFFDTDDKHKCQEFVESHPKYEMLRKTTIPIVFKDDSDYTGMTGLQLWTES